MSTGKMAASNATLGALALLSSATLVGPALAVPLYTITNLGTLGGSWSQAEDINDRGEVTGISESGTGFNAFIYDGISTKNLGVLSKEHNISWGFGINSRGQVAGVSYVETGNVHAFLYDGTLRDLGTLGGLFSDGRDINERGHVTGWSNTISHLVQHAFLYDGNVMKDLGTLGGTQSSGYGINNRGEVTGASYTMGTSYWHAFLYDGTSMKDLGTLGGAQSFGYDINNRGQVTGSAEVTGGSLIGEHHAFLYDGTRMKDLDPLGEFGYSRGFSINDRGQVTGDFSFGDGFGSAFLYDTGSMYDLNNLITPTDSLYGKVELFTSYGINNRGQIIANGLYNDQRLAFLLTPMPIPEPSTIGILVSVLSLFWLLRRRIQNS